MKGVLTEITVLDKKILQSYYNHPPTPLFLCCRWRKVEPQDIVVNCAKLSLDPIEGTTEDLRCPIIPHPQPTVSTVMKPPNKERRPQGSHPYSLIDLHDFYLSSYLRHLYVERWRCRHLTAESVSALHVHHKKLVLKFVHKGSGGMMFGHNRRWE